MKTKGVVIIEGHVQGLANTRALGEEGIPVIVIDKGSCVASASRFCKAYYQCPEYKSTEFIDFLMKLGRDNDLKDWILLPSNDHAVFNISKHLSLVKLIFKTTIPVFSTINLIYNKANLLGIAKDVSVPFPETYYLNSSDDLKKNDIKYPVLSKGKQGLDFYKIFGKKAFLANSEMDLEKQLEEIESVFPLHKTFTQELIPFDGTNKTISLAAFSIDGDIKAFWMGIKLREHPLQFGTATFTESVFEEECLIYAKALLNELKYTGVCEVEFLKNSSDDKYKLIEINARTWLWVGHAISNGVNFPLMVYNYLNKIEQEYPDNYKTGLKWRNPFSDLIFNAIGLVKGHYTINDIRKQNKGKIVDALWRKDDVQPWFKYAFLMLNFLKNR